MYRIQVAAGTVVTLEALKVQLMTFELDIENPGAQNGQSGDALVHKVGKKKLSGGQIKNNTRRKPFDGRKSICWKCGRLGHLKKDCPDWRNKSNDKKWEHNSPKQPDMALMVNSPVRKLSDLYKPNENGWIVDTGATNHMVRDKAEFSEYKTLEPVIPITIGDGNMIYAMGCGVVKTKILDDKGYWKRCEMRNVWHVSKLGVKRLISVGASTKLGCKWEFNSSGFRILQNNRCIGLGGLIDKELYYLRSKSVGGTACIAKENLQVWHEHLADVSPQTIKEMSKHQVVTGLTLGNNDNTKQL
jgi:hypothetical protein